MDQPDPTDWGMSWFELAVSFYLYTGYRFPLKVGNKSLYVDYESDEAIILPGHQRSAVLQSSCLRNITQNLTIVMEQNIFPTFGTFKCRLLIHFGMKGYAAGVPRRPVIRDAKVTMCYVVQYFSKMQGVAMNEPIFQKDLVPTLQFTRLVEPSSAERHNRYAAFMKQRRKRLDRNVEGNEN